MSLANEIRTSECFFHGIELVPADVYRICWECGHPWPELELLAVHNKVLESLAVEGYEAPAQQTDAAKVYDCPL